jgi:predicted nuclease of predicted toxin-antitoxin system
MRILANENIPGEVIAALQARGHDVRWMLIEGAGSTDEVVLSLARAEQRLLVTFDKDFGELAFRSKLPAESGVVLLRMSAHSAQRVAEVSVAVLESRADWAGHFSVIEDDGLRMTPLPPPT